MRDDDRAVIPVNALSPAEAPGELYVIEPSLADSA
jgi:hypothetical protein